MKNLILILFTFLLTSAFAQPPVSADSIYWDVKYCDTGETSEDALTQWIWNGNIGDCIQPSPEFIAAVWPGMWLVDTYECCCQVASLPGSEAAWTGFMGSPCQTYLDSIGFVYNDPDYINWTSLDEIDLELDGIYIDIYGRQYIVPPMGLSIMNKKKYYRL